MPSDGSPCTGERWTRRRDHANVRVMGVLEGWVVMRRKGCIPFLVAVKDFQAGFDRKEADDAV